MAKKKATKKKAAKTTAQGTSFTARQWAFIQEYGKDRNATQAAIRAGYSANGAEVTAHRLLSDAKIRSEIERIDAEYATNCGITKTYVLEKLKKNLLMALGEEDSLNRDGVPVRKIDPSAANKALELMGRYHGMWTERQEISGPGGGPIRSDNVNRAGKPLGEMTDEELAEEAKRLGGG